jgi:LPS-assembly protein
MEVTYDEETHRVSYKKARFEIFGVPLLFTPFLSHSDGKVKQKSGLLSPTAGYDSQLGMMMTNRYYWVISKDRDATIGVMATSKEAPVLLTGYRQRFDNAAIRADGSLTRSGRTDSVAGLDVAKKDDWRGHLFADGLWDINDKWRAGTTLELASDDQYLRQYDFSSKDVLESQVYAERFSGRNYGAARAIAFQDTRILENRTDQPNVLPEIEARFLGKPNEVLGGRWSLEASALGLQRFGSDQDMNRTVLTGGWQRRVITGFGLVNTLDITARADAYSTRDRDLAETTAGVSGSANRGRGTVRGHFLTSYPVVKAMEKMQAVIEPIVALTMSPNIGERFDSIPNEDSQDIQIDTSNLFEPDRFPGYDRIEDRSRITYGVRNGLYGYDGSSLDTFLGQSYRFTHKDNPFPDGSGLEDQASDIVGRITGVYDKNYGLRYAFQLGQDNMSARRHEIDSHANFDRVQLGGRYLFTKALEGTSIDETREQMGLSAGYKLTDHWRMRTGSLHDLGGEDPGLRKASVGFDYVGCCVSFSTTANRNLTTESSGDSGTEITFRFGLKNIGEFEGTSIDLSGLGKTSEDDVDGADAPPL